MKLTQETEREQDERRVYLAGVINDTDEFNRELIKQGLAHPADVRADVQDRSIPTPEEDKS